MYVVLKFLSCLQFQYQTAGIRKLLVRWCGLIFLHSYLGGVLKFFDIWLGLAASSNVKEFQYSSSVTVQEYPTRRAWCADDCVRGSDESLSWFCWIAMSTLPNNVTTTHWKEKNRASICILVLSFSSATKTGNVIQDTATYRAVCSQRTLERCIIITLCCLKVPRLRKFSLASSFFQKTMQSLFLSPSGDLGIGLVWDNRIGPDHRTTFQSDCWNPLQSELNYLWGVLSCFQDDIRWFSD